MTIEIAPKPPAAHKAKPQSANAHSPDNKAEKKAAGAAGAADKAEGKAGAESAGDTGATGFLAILAGLGGADQGAADASAFADAQASGADVTAADGSLVWDAADGSGAGALGDAATLAAQALALTGAVGTTPDAASAAANVDPAKNAAAMAAANAANASDGAKAGKGGVRQSGAQGGLDGDGVVGVLKRGSSNFNSQSGTLGSGSAQGNAQGNARAEQMALSADASANAGNANASTTNASAGKTEAAAFDFKMFAAMQEARGAQDKAPLGSSMSPMLTSLARTEKSTTERAESAKASNDLTYAASAVGVSSNSGFAVGPGVDIAPTPDMQAAEQVKYWISQDVQNAELKLDGLGETPVEVSISLVGNEAHVAFRTDEQQTRGVLEAAGAHLKDMLAREGVVLTGVSVGTSGAQDGSSGERRPRQGVRQATVNAAPLASVDTLVRARGASGRSLDLFV